MNAEPVPSLKSARPEPCHTHILGVSFTDILNAIQLSAQLCKCHDDLPSVEPTAIAGAGVPPTPAAVPASTSSTPDVSASRTTLNDRVQHLLQVLTELNQVKSTLQKTLAKRQ